MSDLSRYAALFREESEELLARLERELLRLEEDAAAPGALEEALRALHTFKGMAATVESGGAAALAHALEDALQPMRNGGAAPVHGVFAAALETVDAVRSAVGSGEDPAFRSRAAALHDRLAGATQAEAPQDGDAAAMPRGGGYSVAEVEREETVRIGRRLLDRVLNEAGELVVLTQRLETLSRDVADRDLRTAARRASRVASGLQEGILAARMVPLSRVFERFPRALRDHARRTGKAVRLVSVGGEIEMDRAILDRVAEPLMHLLRNAVDHGVEPAAERRERGKPSAGTIRLTAWRGGPGVVVEVSDDGRGLDRQRLREAASALGLASPERLAAMADEDVDRLATLSGLTTALTVSETSGRGVGLDAVQTAVTRLGGTLSIRSSEGLGAAFALHLPVTLALLRVLLVEDGGATYGIGLGTVLETRRVEADGARGPARLADLLDAEPRPRRSSGRDHALAEPRIVVLDAAGERLDLRVDSVLGTREVVVRRLPPFRRPLPFHGVTVLGDGSLALLLDAASLAGRARQVAGASVVRS